MINRWLIYFKETGRPGSLLMLTFLLTLTAHSLFQVLQGASTVEFGWITLFGTLNYFLIVLYNRVTDEFKDYEVDVKYFPDRPTASGRVLLDDLRILKEATIVLLFAVNILYPSATIGFLASFLYFYLIAIYFFTPKIHAGNRILAFVTHTPAHMVVHFYLLSLWLGGDFSDVFTMKNLPLVLWLWLPLTIWEVARKTRAPEEEQEGYQTYSAMVGSRASIFAVIIGICIHFSIFCFSMSSWKIATYTFWGMLAITLFFLFVTIRFFIKPKADSSHLKGVSELYNLICYVLVIVNSFFLL